MKAILHLEFNLPEDQPEFDVLANAQQYRNGCDAVLELIRNELKYNDALISSEVTLLERIRTTLLDELTRGDLI